MKHCENKACCKDAFDKKSAKGACCGKKKENSQPTPQQDQKNCPCKTENKCCKPK